jgi:hypothetical protein
VKIKQNGSISTLRTLDAAFIDVGKVYIFNTFRKKMVKTRGLDAGVDVARVHDDVEDGLFALDIFAVLSAASYGKSNLKK